MIKPQETIPANSGADLYPIIEKPGDNLSSHSPSDEQIQKQVILAYSLQNREFIQPLTLQNILETLPPSQREDTHVPSEGLHKHKILLTFHGS